MEQCTQKCGLCSKSKSCDCYQGYFMEEDTCVAACSVNYFLIKEQNKCQKCHKTCKLCTGINDNQCTECFQDFYLDAGMCQSEGKRTFIVVILVVIIGLVISTLCLIKKIFKKEKDKEEIQQKIQKEQEELIRKKNQKKQQDLNANNNQQQIEQDDMNSDPNQNKQQLNQIQLENQNVIFIKNEVQDVTFKPQIIKNELQNQEIIQNNNINNPSNVDFESLNTEGNLLQQTQKKNFRNISRRQSKKFAQANDLIQEFEDNQRILDNNGFQNNNLNPLKQIINDENQISSMQNSNIMEKEFIKNVSVLNNENNNNKQDEENSIYQFSDEEQDNKTKDIKSKSNKQILQNNNLINSPNDKIKNNQQIEQEIQQTIQNQKQSQIQEDQKSQSSEEVEQNPPLFFKLPRVGPPQDLMTKTQEEFKPQNLNNNSRSRQLTQSIHNENDQKQNYQSDENDDKNNQINQ